MKARGRWLSAFIVIECLIPRWNTRHEFLKLLLQQKKISLNDHLNKFCQFNYYIWDVKYAWTSKKCVWCAWSNHLIAALWQFLNIQQLRSRYPAVCQFRANTLLRKANGGVQIWFCPGVPVNKGITIVPSFFRSHWLAVVYCLVFCIGSCVPVHEDRAADLDLVKLAKKRKGVWPALFRGKVCI